MATPEGHATDAVKSRLSDWKCRMFRNNTGGMMNPSGAYVAFGLGHTSKKSLETYRSGDQVGFTPVTITPEMVGKTLPVFTNIEIKRLEFNIKLHYSPNTREYAQNNFNNLIIGHNGIAGFARNWEDVDKIMKDFYNRITV